MTTRMTSRTVVFQRPFVLFGFEQVAPAGTYTVETEEEEIEGASVSAWRRLGTIIHMIQGGTTEYVQIDVADLDKALLRDTGKEETADVTHARLDSARRAANRGRVRRKKF